MRCRCDEAINTPRRFGNCGRTYFCIPPEFHDGVEMLDGSGKRNLISDPKGSHQGVDASPTDRDQGFLTCDKRTTTSRKQLTRAVQPIGGLARHTKFGPRSIHPNRWHPSQFLECLDEAGFSDRLICQVAPPGCNVLDDCQNLGLNCGRSMLLGLVYQLNDADQQITRTRHLHHSQVGEQREPGVLRLTIKGHVWNIRMCTNKHVHSALVRMI
jgi:hypothetical protein